MSKIEGQRTGREFVVLYAPHYFFEQNKGGEDVSGTLAVQKNPETTFLESCVVKSVWRTGKVPHLGSARSKRTYWEV